MQRLQKPRMRESNHFDFFDVDLAFAAAALAADFARVDGLIALFGLSAFRILKTAHAVPTACPAASSPSLVAPPASSPYLQFPWSSEST